LFDLTNAQCPTDQDEVPMERKTTLFSLLATSVLLTACGGGTDPPATTATSAPAPMTTTPSLDTVIAAMGLEGVDSLTYSGSAWRIRNSFRQTLTASPPWPEHDEITNYVRTIDLGAPASKASGDTFASNLFLDPPVAGTYTQNIPATQTAWGQQLEIWLTPWGFLQGAENNAATISTTTMDGEEYTMISWMSPETQTSPSGQRYTVNGYVNDDNLVTRVETWVEDVFMGDMHVVGVYSDYQSFNGLMVPTVMEQQRGGGGIFGVDVTAASANPADLAALMEFPAPAAGGGPGGGGAGAAPTDITQQLADGVYLVTAGYQSIFVEFADHVVVLEAGQSEARGEQILAEVKATIPDKPIRYIVNSHPHSDHTGGLIPFVREGATIVTHANNVAFLDMALSTPRTLLGEETMDPQFMGIEGVGVLEDETRRIDLHSVPNLHTDGMLVMVLAAEGIMFQADFTLPQPGAQANPFVVTLANYVSDNNVQFDQYIAVHAAANPQTRADLLATIGE
jgi:glyoxylase-like metal-dependent hydrolase (beta-lactamase superfamily II)